MCFYCKGDMKPSKTTYTVTTENGVIVIKNVPCEECSQCGAVEFTDEVMEKVEAIVCRLKELLQEVSVVDFGTAA